MGLARFVSIPLLLSALLPAGCAGGVRPPRTAPPGEAEDPLLPPLARILRAEDRREADDSLRAALRDARVEIRARAVRAVGRISPPGAPALLETAIRDPEAPVRREAARGLGLAGEAGAATALVEASRDPDAGVRAEVAVALGRIRATETSGAIAALLADADPRVRAEASLAVWKLPDPSFAVDRLLEASRAADPAIAFCGAYALARLGAEGLEPASSGAPAGKLSPADRRRVRDHLAALASSPVPEVRAQAARGLASPSFGPETRTLGTLSQDPEILVQIAAIRSLGFVSAPVEPYLKAALASKNDALVQAAVEAIGRAATPVASEILLQTILSDRRIWIRETAIQAIGRADPDLAAGIANGLSKEPEPLLRAAAVRNVTGRSDERSLEIVRRVLSDPDPRVRTAAVLSRAGIAGALGDSLGETPSDADPAVREAVAILAGQRIARGTATAEERDEAFSLLEALWARAAQDVLPIARTAIVAAAAGAGTEARARAILDRALADPDWRVRRRASEALRTSFGEEATSRVGPASSLPLERYEEILRWASRPRAAVVTVRREGFAPGRFTLSLDAATAPLASWNFASLADGGFYDGLAVHRVVPGFVVQDGDPRGDGNGDAGWAIRDELGGAPFFAGTLGMASDGPDTAGSQWFVTLSAQPHLDGRYTSFGTVVQNFAGVVAQIRPGDRVVSIRTYEGIGGEPLPPLPQP